MRAVLHKIMIFLLFVLTTTNVYSDSLNSKQLFNQANELYKQNEYHKAIILYDSLIQSGLESSNLFYNTANTYYKLGEFTESILYYEKALLMGGKQKDIIYNLELAKLNITDKIDAIPEFFLVRIWNGSLYLLSSKKWGYLSITLFILVLLFIVLVIVSKSVMFKKIVIPFLSIIILLFVFTTVFTIQKNRLEIESGYAIIFEPTVYVKSAPDNQSTDLFLIHEGLKVKLDEQVDEWIKIELADGKVGWIPEGNYREI